jgi:hypothetical protein
MQKGIKQVRMEGREKKDKAGWCRHQSANKQKFEGGLSRI